MGPLPGPRATVVVVDVLVVLDDVELVLLVELDDVDEVDDVLLVDEEVVVVLALSFQVTTKLETYPDGRVKM
jgi:hypothetical protein